MPKKSIEGIMALVPAVFDENRELDIEGFKENIRYLEDVGMHGIVVGASVGEYYQLDHEEWKKYISAARDVCSRMVLLAGSHFYNTRDCILRSKYADEIGVDGLFVLQPYFSNWLDDEACYTHYKAIHDATHNIQIMMYNYEASGHIISIDLWDRLLRDFPRITAVKECTPAIEMAELIRRFGGRVNVLGGAETSLLLVMLLGGKGSVGVWATAYPEWYLEFYEACKSKKWDKALQYHRQLTKWLWDMKYDPERSLGGNKAVAMAAGRKGGPLREPFRKVTPRTIEYHRRWLKKMGVLK